MAPILLAEQNRIPPETARELRRLSPQQIYIVGGPSVVPEALKQQLAAFTDSGRATSVNRLSGSDRYATNVAVVEEFWTTPVARSVGASGLSP